MEAKVARSLRKSLISSNGHGRRRTAPNGVIDPAEIALEVARKIALRKGGGRLPGGDPAGALIDVIDLFSGCGGISTGFRRYAKLVPVYRLAGALDVDDDCNTTYERNLGLRPFRADARAVVSRRRHWERFIRSLNRTPGNLTVVAAGPPCQGFSSHRNRIDDCQKVNGLFPDCARIASRLSPEVIVIENVPELLTERSWTYYAEGVRVLRRDGYTVRTRIYNLAGFGLPQERFRALTIAMKRPFAMPEPFLERKRYRTVRQAIGDLPRLLPGRADPDDPEHVTSRHRASTLAVIAAVPKNGGRRPLDVGPACLRRLAERNGRTGYDDVYGRLFWDKPAVTITGYSRNPASGRFVHPEQDRALSIREAALLQGFPAGYRFLGTFDGRYLQVGNAVPPSFVAYVAGHILAELLAKPGRTANDEQDVVEPVGTSFSRLIPGIKIGAIDL